MLPVPKIVFAKRSMLRGGRALISGHCGPLWSWRGCGADRTKRLKRSLSCHPSTPRSEKALIRRRFKKLGRCYGNWLSSAHSIWARYLVVGYQFATCWQSKEHGSPVSPGRDDFSQRSQRHVNFSRRPMSQGTVNRTFLLVLI